MVDGENLRRLKVFIEESQKNLPVYVNGVSKEITIDLKILHRVQDNRLPVLTNKQRRVQIIAHLKSYKIYLRNKVEGSYVWSNPFVTGFIEVRAACRAGVDQLGKRQACDARRKT